MTRWKLRLVYFIALGACAHGGATPDPKIAAGYAADALLSVAPEPSPEVVAQRERVGAVILTESPDMEAATAYALAAAIVEESNAASIDPMFIVAMIAVESTFKVDSVSHRGAQGLMQIMPATHKWMLAREVDLQSSDEPVLVRDVRLGIRYYAYLLKAFHRPERALAAYNCGPGRLVDLRKSGAEMPDETKQYPKRVLNAHHRFADDFTRRTKKPVLAAQ